MSVLLATAGYDHSIRFWEATSGICYKTLEFKDSQVNCLRITPEKKQIAAGGHKYLRLYDVSSPNKSPISSCEGHSGNVMQIGFQKDAKWMYSCSEDKTVKIWDFRASKCSRDYQSSASVNTAVLHPNQGEIISGDASGTISIWDLTANKCRKEILPEGDSPIHSISVAPDASLVAVCNKNGNCYLWRPKEEEEESAAEYEYWTKLHVHDNFVLHCQISPDVKVLSTTSSDCSIKLWNTKDLSLKSTLKKHQRWVWDCVFSADSNYLVSVSSDMNALLWDVQAGSVVRHYTGHHKAVTAVALNDATSLGTHWDEFDAFLNKTLRTSNKDFSNDPFVSIPISPFLVMGRKNNRKRRMVPKVEQKPTPTLSKEAEPKPPVVEKSKTPVLAPKGVPMVSAPAKKAVVTAKKPEEIPKKKKTSRIVERPAPETKQEPVPKKEKPVAAVSPPTVQKPEPVVKSVAPAVVQPIAVEAPPTVRRFRLPFETTPGQVLAIVGSLPELGSWNPAGALRMTWSEGHIWTAEIESATFEYKYVLLQEGKDVTWENGMNRVVSTSTPPDQSDVWQE